MRSDEAVGELFEHIETACRDGVTVEAGQLGKRPSGTETRSSTTN